MSTPQYVPQTLRNYQREAVAAIRKAWADGKSAPMAALATGAGKTRPPRARSFWAVQRDHKRSSHRSWAVA